MSIDLAPSTQSDPTPDERVELWRQDRLKAVMELGENAVLSYFHGTNYPLSPGDEIVPGRQAVVDKDGFSYASASRYEDGAWHYADSKEALEGGRGRVYKVVPSDGKTAEHLGPQYGEVNSRRFTVVDQIDIQPGRQGTLPGINWNNHSPYSYENHPQDPPWTFHDDWQEPEVVSPEEVPLPGLGEEYVQDELERRRKELGIPFV
ncbi:MAG TPA: hypothetical protein PK096_02050 [Candidatus Saccharibacteria bacterium]|nr:hypothetical protein [Candidatus Saccharibacteria bacterium]HRK94130.1 hypothetical protein [Candidatus Saccharibacteria bacterium]